MDFLPLIIRAEYRQGYRIRLTFNDGRQKTVGFSVWLDGPVFEPLRDQAYFLRHECVPGMPASASYFRYMIVGKEPFIVEDSESPDTSPGFSALDYAKTRCEELCSRPGESDVQRLASGPGLEGLRPLLRNTRLERVSGSR